ncbi:MAG: DUF2975 domain-containing protein [Actinobacteria bacterium]|nr:DUF2975 domain-containing protein [Chloroflexota bacterium]MBE3138675.1 DUF2975 domain-containing protein [Actinomycetota bacterium]
MKYLGKKSLSFFLSGLLHVSWYVILVVSIIGVVYGAIVLFATPVENPAATGIARVNFHIFNGLGNDKEFQMIRDLPIAVRILFLPYFGAVAVLLLQTIKKSQYIFTNFKNDIVFSGSNVVTISKICKLIIVFSIMTFNFTSLLVAIILLIFNDVLKKGTTLQEEHDLTI